jgi:hypothetical protein
LDPGVWAFEVACTLNAAERSHPDPYTAPASLLILRTRGRRGPPLPPEAQRSDLREDLRRGRPALDEKSSVSYLLRKALVVAAKLQVSDSESWARSDLQAYQDGSVPISEYRKLHGAPKVWNPYHGYQELQYETPKLAQIISFMPLGASVDALEEGRGKEGRGRMVARHLPGFWGQRAYSAAGKGLILRTQ